MTLDEALRDITKRITCVEWDADENRDAHIAPTGEPYIELCSGGVKNEGDDRAPCLCARKEIAVSSWRLALLDYEAKKPGILYWRVMPEMDEVVISGRKDVPDTTYYFVYSRLLISTRSVIRSVRKPAA